MNCLSKHALHRLNPTRDETVARELNEGYAFGLKWFGSTSPECEAGIVKSAVEEISTLVDGFVGRGGIEALDPAIRTRLSETAIKGFLVALFERAYS